MYINETRIYLILILLLIVQLSYEDFNWHHNNVFSKRVKEITDVLIESRYCGVQTELLVATNYCHESSG